MMHYSFEVLPVHPKIYSLESLTGYLIRLAVLNKIKSVDGISFTLFPEQSKRVTREIADFVPLNIETLKAATNRTEAELLQATFHHLVVKFGRSAHPQALSRFVSSAISDHFRYCPYCLSETAYYSLLWRFKIITVCIKHLSWLRDHCPNCGKLLPLFKAPFNIGSCQNCGGSLVNCEANQFLKS